MTSINLPNGWTNARLGDLVELRNGFAFTPRHWKGTGLPIIRIQNLNNPDSEFHYCPDPIGDQFIVRNGDLLFAWSGTPGTSFGAHVWRGGDAWLNQHIFRVDFNAQNLDRDFLRLALNHNLAQYVAEARGGSGLKHVTKATIQQSTLALPPLPEQHRIVAAVDVLTSRLDAAEALLASGRAKLRGYLTAVHRLAFEGRLAAPEAETAASENREYETAAQLLERLGFGAGTDFGMTNRSLPPGWASVHLCAVAELQAGLAKGKRRRQGEVVRDVLYLRVANVQRGYLDLRDVRTISATESEIDTLRLSSGDVLFTEGGDRDKLGRGWVWRDQLPECIHQNHVFRARLQAVEIQPEFVSWFGNTLGQRYFAAAGRQTTNLASISIGTLGKLPLLIAPASEQRRIVDDLEQRFSTASHLQGTIHSAAKRIEQIRKAVVERAVAGKLVDQHPGDEAAEQLLLRIRRSEPQPTSEPKGRGSMAKQAPHERRNILAVLRSLPRDQSVTPEDLFREAGFTQADVDVFYAELKRETLAGRVGVERPQHGSVRIVLTDE